MEWYEWVAAALFLAVTLYFYDLYGDMSMYIVLALCFGTAVVCAIVLKLVGFIKRK